MQSSLFESLNSEFSHIIAQSALLPSDALSTKSLFSECDND